MTILYFYQYFSTSNGSWGTRVYEFAKQWVDQGYRVIVVTSVYSKSDLIAKRFIDKQLIDGIEVIIINIRIDNKQSFIKRIISFIQYAIIASYYAIKIECDAVIASSGPITVTVPGLLSKIIRGRKLVFEVRDLWPQGAIELGHLNNLLLQRFAFWIEKFSYKKSDLIVALSPGMIQNIQTRYGMGYKCISVPNAVNLKLFSTTNLNSITNKREKNFSYAIYTGNIGDVNNSMWLLNAARKMQLDGVKGIKILMVGDGQQKESILMTIKNEKIQTLEVLDLMPKSELVPLIQNAIVSLVPLKGTPILDTSSPNKFFESLGAGVPIIQNTNGWMKDFLLEYNVGVTIDPNDHISLVREIVRLNGLTNEQVLEMRYRCIKLAKQFDKDILAAKMINALHNL